MLMWYFLVAADQWREWGHPYTFLEIVDHYHTAVARAPLERNKLQVCILRLQNILQRVCFPKEIVLVALLGSLTFSAKSMGFLERKSVNERSREGKGRRWNRVPWILLEFYRGGMKEQTDKWTKLNKHRMHKTNWRNRQRRKETALNQRGKRKRRQECVKCP